MFSTVVALAFSVCLVSPISVFAQYSNYIPTYSNLIPPITPSVANYAVSCLNLNNNLYKGLFDSNTGGEVSMLQAYMISQNYLPIAAPSGYYGALTVQAVKQYQIAHGLPSDGIVGVSTRQSIQNISCGNAGYNGGYNYGYNNYNNYYGAPVITSLSTNSGYVGQSITIYGSGFDLYNNTIIFDGITLDGIPSYQGQAMAFAVPQLNNYNNYSGSYSVSVMTSRGTSNPISFSVLGGSYNYNNYNNCYDNGYYYQNQPELNSISPSSGHVGRQVTLYGSGFTRYDNTVHFGNGGKSNVSSSNGDSIRFTIPSSVGPCDITTGGYACAAYEQLVTPGSYPIYVSNSKGQTGTIYFNVTY